MGWQAITYSLVLRNSKQRVQKGESHKTCQKHARDIVSSQNQKEKSSKNERAFHVKCRNIKTFFSIVILSL